MILKNKQKLQLLGYHWGARGAVIPGKTADAGEKPYPPSSVQVTAPATAKARTEKFLFHSW